MTDPDQTFACGAFQPDPPAQMRPYRCTEPYDHDGDHWAVLDGEALAWWPRHVDRHVHLPEDLA